MARQTGSATPRELAEPPLWRRAPVTSALIAVTVGVHLAGVANAELQAVLFERGAQVPAAVEAGEWYRLVTSAFLHSDNGWLVVLHPLFNMLWVFILGRELEPRVGSAPFAALYLSTAIGGSTAAHLAGQGGVGASGAVFGLLGALFVQAVRRRREPGGKRELHGWLWLLGFGLSMPLWVGPLWGRIGWEAHLGGLAAGMLVGVCWAAASPQAARLRTGLAAAVGGLGLALVLSGGTLAVDAVEAGPSSGERRASEQERTALLQAELGPAVVVSGQAPSGEAISVDPRTLGYHDDEDVDVANDVEVVTPQRSRARRGLAAASERWFLVDHTGREWGDMEELDRAFESSPDLDVWTIPYVSEIAQTDGGLTLWVDLEGGMLAPGAQARFLEILVEELQAAGVTSAHIRRPAR